MKWINAFYLICIFPFAAFSADYKQGQDAKLNEADSLFQAGNYFEASIGFERIFFGTDNPEVKTMANLRKAEAYKQMGEYARARNDLERSLMYGGNHVSRMEVLYQMAFCAYMESDFADANALVLQWKHLSGGEIEHRVMLLQALLLVEEWAWDELRSHLEAWLAFADQTQAQADTLLAGYDMLVTDLLPAREKSVHKARMLSTFIPGAGQVYAGEAGWGLLNATSQLAALGAFTWLAFNGFYLAGPIAGLGLFQSLYFGGINQAGELTQIHNTTLRNQTRTAAAIFLINLFEQLSGGGSTT